jgi:GABA permease
MVFIVGTLGIMLFQEAHRVEIIATGVLSLLVVAGGCSFRAVARPRA